MTPPNHHPTTLDEWIATSEPKSFPLDDRDSHVVRLKSVSNYLDKNVYPEIDIGVLLQDGLLLTKHGKVHVDTVVRRASELVIDNAEPNSPFLTPYEVFLLLMAIYFHDVGNVYGRVCHEQAIVDVIDKFKEFLSDETVERRTILEIAKAHSGTVDGTNKDTIGKLPSSDPVLGKPVRKQALAAILRFADELSDDSSRSVKFLRDSDGLPEKSKVYHHYAKALHSVNVQPSEHIVNLQYLFHSSDATRTFGKGNGSVYLLDEIYSRTLKMYHECEYCMRFTHGIVRIDTISVKIEVYRDDHALIPAIQPIHYRLSARGYPSHGNQDIHEHVPGLMSGLDLAGSIGRKETDRGTE